ncbi:MAG: LptF/LptG family permease [Xenococcaceae cyanobacterium]
MNLGKSQFLSSFLGGLSVMDRYIAAELIPPFLFSVGIFSSVGVAVGTLSDLVNKVFESDLPLRLALQVFLLKLPEFTSYAFPISVLLATLMTYGRLSSDSELIALRSCGVSIYRLVAPAVVLSLVVTGITFLFNELVVPAANYQATTILVKALNEEKPFFQKKDIFYPEYQEVTQSNGEKIWRLRSLFYAERFDGKGMKDLTILKWSGQRLNQIIISDSAIWNPAQNTWDFLNGTIYLISPDASYGNTLRFDNQQLPLSRAPLDLAIKGRDPYEMNIAQAWEYMKILRFSGDEKKLLIFQVRTQQKIAFPFVCLVFGLVGSVLGCHKHTSRATSFGISVAIIFAYYLLGFIIGCFGLVGILSPFMAAWLPNFFGLGVGGWLLVRIAR